MLEADGVTLEDRQTGALRFHRSFLVLDGGRWRTLELRVGRGTLRDATPGERKAAMREIQRAGGKASAAKLTEQQRSERARKAAMAMSSEERTERARKAGRARHGRSDG